MINYKIGDKVLRTISDSFLVDMQSYKVEKFLYRVGQVTPFLIEVSDDNGTPSFFDPASLRKDISHTIKEAVAPIIKAIQKQQENGHSFILATANNMEKIKEAMQSEQSTKGIKYDPDKLQYSLIPPYALEEVARNLTIGLKKYPHRDNWKLVQDAEQRYLDALIRHLEAHRKGEVFDPDNPSVYHLAAVAVNAMFLLEFMTNPELDSKVFNKE